MSEVEIFLIIVVVFLMVGGIIYFFFFCMCIKELCRCCKVEYGNYFNVGIIMYNFDYILCLLIIFVGVIGEFVFIFIRCYCDY